MTMTMEGLMARSGMLVGVMGVSLLCSCQHPHQAPAPPKADAPPYVWTDDPKALFDTYIACSMGQRKPPAQDPSEAGQLVLRQTLQVLQFCYQARDKNYDVKTADRGTMNVSPPRFPGRRPYMSGVAPECIEEPEVRQAYIEKLAENKRKCEKYNRESRLEETLDRGIREVRAGVESFPKESPDRKIIMATISSTITNETLRARFLDGLGADARAWRP